MKQLRVLPKHLWLRITRSWFKQINYQLNKIAYNFEVIFLTIDGLWIFQMVIEKSRIYKIMLLDIILRFHCLNIFCCSTPRIRSILNLFLSSLWPSILALLFYLIILMSLQHQHRLSSKRKQKTKPLCRFSCTAI